jgi:hypothetical protein
MGQQLWMTDNLGGYLSNDVLSKQIRHSAQPIMKFRQFVTAEAAAGKNRGDKVLFNKISNISTVGGTLTETDTIPKRNYTIVQGSLSVTEYGRKLAACVRLLLEVLKPNQLFRLNWGGYCG